MLFSKTRAWLSSGWQAAYPGWVERIPGNLNVRLMKLVSVKQGCKQREFLKTTVKVGYIIETALKADLGNGVFAFDQ